MKSLSHVRLFVTQWTVAYQAPQSMEFSRQEYWSGSPFPSPGDLPNPGIETRSPAIQADTLPSETRDRTHVPCIGRQILNHCATRKVPARDFKLYSFEILSGYKVTCLHHLLFFSFLFFYHRTAPLSSKWPGITSSLVWGPVFVHLLSRGVRGGK